MISPKIKDIATRCRTICEDFAWSHDAMEYDYFKSQDLHKMCAVASFFLKAVLEKENIKIFCRKACDRYLGHVFNEIGGYVIDLTATQFGSEEKVLIQKLEKYEEWLDLGKSKICKKVCWGTGQSPHKKVLDKLVKLYYNEV